jgi:hypothetical protein
MLTPHGDRVERIYRSRFREWDTRSAVRAKPLPAFGGQARDDVLFFTPELVPAATHPAVRALGPNAIHHALTHHLFEHLSFTDALENEIVTPVASMIGRRQLGFAFPPGMVTDARKIAVDEMHHALLTGGFMDDIAAQSQVSLPPARRPAFLLALDDIKSSHDRSLAPLLTLFFAIVSETLITGTLTKVPNDERVVGGVRKILRDHAEDEARHHVYFAEVLLRCWPQLTSSERTVVGPLLPRFISLFLSPDLVGVQISLNRLGICAPAAERIIEESYSAACTSAAIRAGSEAIMRLMKRAGVLEDARTADAFHEFGLG